MLLNENLPPGYMWSGRRPTKIQASTRPDYLRLEIWIGMSKAAKEQEKQEWAVDKSKLDNGRTLRGIYFIDREDEECEETI